MRVLSLSFVGKLGATGVKTLNSPVKTKKRTSGGHAVWYYQLQNSPKTLPQYHNHHKMLVMCCSRGVRPSVTSRPEIIGDSF
jgi:hypothetical protein